MLFLGFRVRPYVKSSFDFLVTSQTRHILSNGSSLRRAVLCMIAVSKDCGLKKPASQTTEGSCGQVYYFL